MEVVSRSILLFVLVGCWPWIFLRHVSPPLRTCIPFTLPPEVQLEFFRFLFFVFVFVFCFCFTPLRLAAYLLRQWILFPSDSAQARR